MYMMVSKFYDDCQCLDFDIQYWFQEIYLTNDVYYVLHFENACVFCLLVY